ncbi:MAG: SDR family NAD(P)-dependent oxidoreductase [Polyangiaceae bacterium]|nr:SDR family NAD(P)-dependent oxidoreductase [Polyangiaceae bacterium]
MTSDVNVRAAFRFTERCQRRVGTVLITGTTSGIGRALLEHYVESGTRVISVNRRRIAELECRYPSVRFECVDVRCAEDVDKLVRDLAASGQLPELFILNAGINRVDNDESFQLPVYREVIETNLYGVLNFVQPLTELPAVHVRRHVVAIGSMASYAGNPYGLGYSTSKKALSACFEVWAKMYAGTDLVFQQVMLGPVRTAMYTMADKFPAWMVWTRNLFSASLEAAVRAVSRFALTRKSRLVYPLRAFPLYLAMWLGQALVPGFFQGRKTLDGRARRAGGSPRPAR